ncbi:hypothetical protein BKM77_02275 [Pseudomonas syringae]|nr:hypothetical protein BKM77_02275 [Pseudomonas syringae]
MRPTPKHLALYTDFVGASLLAKAIAQTPCFLRLHWPIREQARSHRTDALRGIHTGVIDDDMRTYAEALGVVRRFGGSELARESDCPDALFSAAALAYSRASSLPQGRCAAGIHTGVIDDDMRTYAEALGVVHSFCGSELARESDCPDALFSAAALAYSRASSLPRGRCATGMHTGVVDDDMRPMLKRLALYTDFVGASLLAKAIGQTPCFLRLHWPIREQARSHRADALRGCTPA